LKKEYKDNLIVVNFDPEWFKTVQSFTKEHGHVAAKKALIEAGYVESVAECVMRRIMKWGW